MADVFPRRNLPDLAEQWGREVETRVSSLNTGVEIVGQQVQSLNRNTASSLALLADQITKLEEAQEAIEEAQRDIEATQAEIISAQADIVATTNFLSTQTISDSNSTVDSFTGSNSGTTWRAFSGTYDCSVSVTTGSAGKLLIQASANLTGGALTALLGIEIVGVLGPTYPGPYSTYVTDGSAGVTRVVTASLSPNSTYTVRLRRGIDGSTTGLTIWRDQTLSVTRS